MTDQPTKLLVPISQINREYRTQARITTCDIAVEDYADAMESGDRLPPVVLFQDATGNYIGDGWQRILAADEVGYESIDALVYPGGLRAAILYAAGANQKHGVRRSPEDKRRAVESLLDDEEWRLWSDRMIADQCGVSNAFVSKIRNERLASNGQKTEKKKPPKDSTPAGGVTVYENTGPPDQGGKSSGDSTESDQDIDFFEPYENAIDLLNTVKSSMSTLAKDKRLGFYLFDVVTRITTSIDEVKGIINKVKPDRLCKKCSGDGCDNCQGIGFFTKTQKEK